MLKKEKKTIWGKFHRLKAFLTFIHFIDKRKTLITKLIMYNIEISGIL